MGTVPSSVQPQDESTSPLDPSPAGPFESNMKVESASAAQTPPHILPEPQAEIFPDKTNALPSSTEPEDIKPGDVVIAVMGVTGSGKTTFVNYFADVEVEIGHGLEPCTQNVQVIPCTLDETQRMWLVDTPGFDDTYRTDAEILREIANWLSTAYKMKIKLTGIIYLHRILDPRLGNAAVKNIRMFKKLCGDDGLGSVVLATTMWGHVPSEATGANREQELKTQPIFWKYMIQHGSEVFRQDRGRKSGAEIVKYLIQKRRPVTLDIQREMNDKKMLLLDTGAGVEVAAEVEKKSVKWENDLKDIRREIQDAIVQRDLDVKSDLEVMKKETETNLRREQDEIRKMQINSDQLFQQMQQQHEQEIKKWTELLQEKDRLIEGAQKEASDLKQSNDLELDKFKLQMQLKERYYKMVYASRCTVM